MGNKASKEKGERFFLQTDKHMPCNANANIQRHIVDMMQNVS